MAKVRASFLAALLEFVESSGGDSAQVRAASGFREAEPIDSDRMLDFDRVAAALSFAARELKDPALGLHAGATFDLGTFGPVTYTVLNAPTVEVALNNLARYLGVFVQGARSELLRKSDVAIIRVNLKEFAPEAARHLSEAGGMLLVRMLRRLVGDSCWQPVGIAFEHSAPPDLSEHERLLGLKPTFMRPSNEIRLDASVLSRTISGADRFLLPIVERRLQELLAADPRDERWLTELRVRIASEVCDGHPNLQNLARALGMSPRTLQRRLADRRLSYRDLVQQVRHDLALHYVERTETDLTEIALLLGYSELAAFAHAFRRWTGDSPGARRRAFARIERFDAQA